MSAYDWFRNLLNIRKRRARPREGFKPKVGAKIVLDGLRMIVQAGLSDELWGWLQEAGFREMTYSPDRRSYRELPPSLVTRLYDAPPEEWQALLMKALREASKRPRVRVGSRSVQFKR